MRNNVSILRRPIGRIATGVAHLACWRSHVHRSHCLQAGPEQRPRLGIHAKHREKLSRVAPNPVHPPAGAVRGVGEASDVELPASLRMDGFTFRKREAPASHGNSLRLAANQVHLDRELTLVPSGLVGERLDRKIAFELTIDAAEKVEIELRGDASSVIVRGDQSPDVFAQVDSDDRLATLTDMLAHAAKQGGGFGLPKIAECGARKKAARG